MCMCTAVLLIQFLCAFLFICGYDQQQQLVTFGVCMSLRQSQSPRQQSAHQRAALGAHFPERHILCVGVYLHLSITVSIGH